MLEHSQWVWAVYCIWIGNTHRTRHAWKCFIQYPYDTYVYITYNRIFQDLKKNALTIYISPVHCPVKGKGTVICSRRVACGCDTTSCLGVMEQCYLHPFPAFHPSFFPYYPQPALKLLHICFTNNNFLVRCAPYNNRYG